MNIISAYREVETYRGAAVLCGTTHKTVKRVVQRAEDGGSSPSVARIRNFDHVRDVVAERVAASRGRISAKRLLPIAKSAGYEGSERNFRRLVAEQKALWRRNNHRGRRPAVWSPGDYLVIDWAEAAAGLFMFCAVLAYSRWRFVRFAGDQKASTTLAMIAEALALIGGVPAKVLADRMGCLKGGVVANVVVPTAAYVRFATHYGFRPDFCHANDPESKGIVENLCGYAQADLMVPLLTEAKISGFPISIAAANAAATEWCSHVNATEHSEIAAVPDQRLASEREVLGPVPSLQAEISSMSVTRKVDRLSCIRYGSARYSVPTRFIGATVAIVIDQQTLRVVDIDNGRIVAEHDIVAPGETSVLDEHYERPRRAPSRGPRPKTPVEQQFCALGEQAEAFLVGAAASGNTRLGAELEILLTLGAAYGHDNLVAALDRATAFKRFRAADVRSILDTGTAYPKPRPAGTALVLDLPSAQTRSLEDYKITHSSDRSTS